LTLGTISDLDEPSDPDNNEEEDIALMSGLLDSSIEESNPLKPTLQYALTVNGSTLLSGNARVEGNILSTGNITAYTTSDRRLKDNIKDIDCIKAIKTLGGIK